MYGSVASTPIVRVSVPDPAEEDPTLPLLPLSIWRPPKRSRNLTSSPRGPKNRSGLISSNTAKTIDCGLLSPLAILGLFGSGPSVGPSLLLLRPDAFGA